MNQEQQLSAALLMVNVQANEQTSHLILSVVKALEEKGGKFDIETAIELKGANLAKYSTEPPIVPHEVESGEQNLE